MTAVLIAIIAVLAVALASAGVALRREQTPRRSATLFHYSLLYLALLFVAAAVGSVV